MATTAERREPRGGSDRPRHVAISPAQTNSAHQKAQSRAEIVAAELGSYLLDTWRGEEIGPWMCGAIDMKLVPGSRKL